MAHALKNGLQRSDRRGIVKKHEKGVQAGLGVISKAFWVVPVRFPALNKGKFIKNWQTGTRESFLGAIAA